MHQADELVPGATTIVPAAWAADALVVWAAQGFGPAVGAWTNGGALAVASPGLARRDRLVLAGDPDAAAALLRALRPVVGPTYRPMGDRALVESLAARDPERRLTGTWGWMETPLETASETPLATPLGTPPEMASETASETTDSTPGARHRGASRPPAPHVGTAPGASLAVGWLDDSARDEVAALVAAAFPSSYAVPGEPGIRRWAGLRAGGRLVAVGADAWASPEVAFVSGVATCPTARRSGHARTLCRFLLGALGAAHGRVGLFVDEDNIPAIALYRSLGMRYRAVGALGTGPAPADQADDRRC